MSTEKTLNDIIDGLFRGIVFIFLDFFKSIFAVLMRPHRGSVWLVKCVHSRSHEQVRPLVFLFLSLSTVFFIGIVAHPLSLWGTWSGASPVVTSAVAIQDAIESKKVLICIVACIAGVTIFDVLSVANLRLFIKRPSQRLLAYEALLYVCGVQVLMLMTIAAVGGFATDKFATWPLEMFRRIFPVPYVSPNGWSDTVTDLSPMLRVFIGILMGWMLIFPLPLALRLAKKPGLTIGTSGRLRRYCLGAWIALTTTIFAGVAFTSAAWIVDGTTGENPLKYNLVDSVCQRTTEAGVEKIVVLAIVESTSEKARLASPGDFVVGIGWNASEFTPSDDPGYLYSSPPTRPWELDREIGVPSLTSNGKDSPVLIEPRKPTLIHAAVALDKSILADLSKLKAAKSSTLHCNIGNMSPTPPNWGRMQD